MTGWPKGEGDAEVACPVHEVLHEELGDHMALIRPDAHLCVVRDRQIWLEPSRVAWGDGLHAKAERAHLLDRGIHRLRLRGVRPLHPPGEAQPWQVVVPVAVTRPSPAAPASCSTGPDGRSRTGPTRLVAAHVHLAPE